MYMFFQFIIQRVEIRDQGKYLEGEMWICKVCFVECYYVFLNVSFLQVLFFMFKVLSLEINMLYRLQVK